MPILTPGAVTRVRQPTLLVENRLEVGSWLFRLTVVDDGGLESDPADLVVRVIDPTGPVGPVGPIVRDPRILEPLPPLEPTRPTGPIRPIPEPGPVRRPIP